MFARHTAALFLVERSLHGDLLSELATTEGDIADTGPCPTTLAYTSYLIATCATGPFSDGIAAVLPATGSTAKLAGSRGACRQEGEGACKPLKVVAVLDEVKTKGAAVQAAVGEAADEGVPEDRRVRASGGGPEALRQR